tara:strand:- start:175 stop:1560 length:1386 start_codon:yes stop_codon:yes gene_type:complete
MDEQTLRNVIDYFIFESGISSPDSAASIAAIFSGITIVILSVSAVFQMKQVKEAAEQRNHDQLAHTIENWNRILDDCQKMPEFLDLQYTENYFEEKDLSKLMKYEVLCQKIWGFIYRITTLRFYKNDDYKLMIDWATWHHYTWLQRNPDKFVSEEFWKTIESARAQPPFFNRYTALPQKDGDIDWGAIVTDAEGGSGQVDWAKISERYHANILSPFAPEMVLQDSEQPCRNKLLDYISKLDPIALKSKRVADFGCGSGNLIPHLQKKVSALTGVEKNKRVLEIAAQHAKDCGIVFEEENQDICTFKASQPFDLIISVNSILPSNRQDVGRMLRSIHAALSPGGHLLAIMPSFDTIEYLHELIYENIKKKTSEAHAKRVITHIRNDKKFDTENQLYADDGMNIQCYHTKESIVRDFKDAKLKIQSIEKIYYPWDLTRRFDYGFFPNAAEEIWDWFVIAEKAQ